MGKQHRAGLLALLMAGLLAAASLNAEPGTSEPDGMGHNGTEHTGAWLKKVSAADRKLANPIAGSSDAVAAGGAIYQAKCAKCHGTAGTGRKGLPSLLTPRVVHATDGEIFWILQHGSQDNGMPAWTKLPEGDRWRIVSYVRSLQTAEGAGADHKAGAASE